MEEEGEHGRNKEESYMWTTEFSLETETVGFGYWEDRKLWVCHMCLTPLRLLGLRTATDVLSTSGLSRAPTATAAAYRGHIPRTHG